ncbi:D-hexose-6-phosphate mutarotase [Gayadomonas joobiniege]|uniref:D-hexose-6-phosphate mutarotase n=1 Tax=Gayadomonas joobiniege TaxID=1234606 RepID=UPI00037CF3EE|nr:D-hexose-6-phosphate mutarotase [Gayadomonas joobiniege]
MCVQELVKKFSCISVTDAKSLYGETQDALPLLKINHELFDAVIAIQGAHLVEFSAKGKDPLLWLSPQAIFKQGKAIRGGIPVCFPWFGDNQLSENTPSHGFVRNRDWQLADIDVTAEQVSITFKFTSNEETQTLYPYSFEAEYKIQLNHQIELALTAINLSDTLMPVSFALHSYHPVADIETVYIDGLHYTTYLDNTAQLAAKIQQGPVHFSGELDRIYLNVAEQQRIQSKTPIVLRSKNCHSAIVWNPGPEKAAQLIDLGEQNYPSFVCVERGNAFSDSWYLAPKEKRQAELLIGYADGI